MSEFRAYESIELELGHNPDLWEDANAYMDSMLHDIKAQEAVNNLIDDYLL